MTRRQFYIVGAQCAVLLALIGAIIFVSRSPVTPTTLAGVWQRSRLDSEAESQFYNVPADPSKLSKFIVFGSDGTFFTSAGGDVIAHGTYRLLDNGQMTLTIDTLEAIYSVRVSGTRLSLTSDLMPYEYYRSVLPPVFQ